MSAKCEALIFEMGEIRGNQQAIDDRLISRVASICYSVLMIGNAERRSIQN